MLHRLTVYGLSLQAPLFAVFEPSERVSMSYFTATKNFLVVSTLDNVCTRLVFWKYVEGVWEPAGEMEDAVIANVSMSAVDSDESDQVGSLTSERASGSFGSQRNQQSFV
jgi:prolyl oligopeptidase PreP (S9A serine peptidase family)